MAEPQYTVDPRTSAMERAWDGKESIPISEWGKDHWSTLAYLETRCVDGDGEIGNDHMRTNARRHRKLLGDTMIRAQVIGGDHPTLLSKGCCIPKHDDWDCMYDAVAAGFIVIAEEWDRRPDLLFGGWRFRVALTDLGNQACAEVRAHKASGGSFGDFSYSEASR